MALLILDLLINFIVNGRSGLAHLDLLSLDFGLYWAISASYAESFCSYCWRVDSIKGAASDSVTLIWLLHLGQVMTGSFIALIQRWP